MIYLSYDQKKWINFPLKGAGRYTGRPGILTFTEWPLYRPLGFKGLIKIRKQACCMTWLRYGHELVASFWNHDRMNHLYVTLLHGVWNLIKLVHLSKMRASKCCHYCLTGLQCTITCIADTLRYFEPMSTNKCQGFEHPPPLWHQKKQKGCSTYRITVLFIETWSQETS